GGIQHIAEAQFGARDWWDGEAARDGATIEPAQNPAISPSATEPAAHGQGGVGAGPAREVDEVGPPFLVADYDFPHTDLVAGFPCPGRGKSCRRVVGSGGYACSGCMRSEPGQLRFGG